MNDQPHAHGPRAEGDDGSSATPSWRSLLGAVDVPAQARDAAITAALAEYDRTISQAPARMTDRVADGSTHRAPVVELAPRRRLRLLGAAAAVLVVGGAVLGSIAARQDGDVEVEVADPAVMASARTESAPTVEGEVFATPGLAASTVTIDSIDAPASASADDGGANAAGGTAAPMALAETALPDIDSPTALAAFAASIAPGTGVGEVAGSPCAPERTEMLGLVMYQGSPAVVGRDISGQVVALDAATCVLLVAVTP